jgi:hypothetical protein
MNRQAQSLNNRFNGGRSAGALKWCVAAAVAATVGLLGGCGGGEEPGTSEYILTLTSEPTGAGSFSTVPSGTAFSSGTEVTVTVSPKAGYKFLEWEGASTSKDTTVKITMNADKKLTAKFEKLFKLVTVVEPESAGTVKRNRDPLYGMYDTAGTRITLTATADTANGYKFDGWAVNDSIVETDVQYRPTVNSDTTITAKFHKMYKVIVTITGDGEVSLNPDKPFYDEGEEVTLTAEPIDDFMSWRGPDGTTIIGEDPVLTITIEKADVKLTAKF